jgi:hypothetical protein
MVINLVLQQLGIRGNPVDKQNLVNTLVNAPRVLLFFNRYSQVDGATGMTGVTNAFNDLNKELVEAGGPDLGTAVQGYGTKSDLIGNVKNGYYTMIVLHWPLGQGSHWVVVVGYDEASDEFLILNGGPDYQGVLPEDRIERWGWGDLDENWSRPLLGGNEMITFIPAREDE